MPEYHSWEEALELIPGHMHDGITRYLRTGIKGGSFQMAVFSNDFMGACIMADDANKQHLAQYGEFLQYCPAGSYGSPSHIRAWEGRRGLAGIAEKDGG